MAPLQIPILRAGAPYESMEKVAIFHHATGEIVAEVSQANPGLISRDIHRMDGAVLERFCVRELMAMCRQAASLFMSAELPVGDRRQSFDDYICQLSATTGMPVSYCRSNASKIHRVLDEIDVVVAGLTRGFDLSILDKGFGSDDGRMLSWFRECRIFGGVLPSNSPGVHSLWIPAVALKTPLALKPGREEPWTPFRVIQALIGAGMPKEAFGFYPTDHGGAGTLLQGVDRGMLFGDAGTTRAWAKDPRIELHGPGYSKVILGEDEAEYWRNHIDLIVSSISANGGRSCINASSVWTPSHADEIAEALSSKFAGIQALPADDVNASIAGFANAAMAARINAMIDGMMPGAEDVTARLRGSSRLTQRGRVAYLLPTIIRCDRDHAMANREFLFPFATVVECPQSEIVGAIGPTLVATAITKDQRFIHDLMGSESIDRLNVGPVPTWRLSWDQPHEGNLFELLYRQRAFQVQDVEVA